ncbi:hypothetical protein TcG_03498 [Trypanosoma cruzi]|uniref:Uncharacterized protein n=2 Tax=Trypanosoma cruzi TaxID=5693 RepID=V5DD69_TRYCR|nr:hypothetical protein TCDM_06211 [Trypanosoma cruzi Dm28c]PBJ74894.1 hypothetical protein BCY84_11988 [Trypanosoma cruzi cruzi]PBJ80086.1 hypothetical protein BCY84_01968 [Trypanosoma cruzi cruzi]PWU87754.1 hypothetical protein C4B63_85g57 [Trypanosoma cruzi]RNF20718.1 hypothetical protein TcG_03498 [Trypanosoma cruzi]
MAPRRENGAAKPACESARRLDFYLPPPDDRAYRRGRIQRLRDQITAWRRQPRRGSAQAYARAASAGTEQRGLVVDTPLWKASTVSPTRRNVSRHEKVFMLSQVSCSPPSAKHIFSSATQGGDLRDKTPLRSSNYTNMKNSFNHKAQTTGRVMEVPYFHDQTIFCLPRDRRVPMNAATVDAAAALSDAMDDGESQQTDSNAGFCYGVTSNSEEMTRHSEHLRHERKADRDGKPLPEKTTFGSDRFEGAPSVFFSSLQSKGGRAASAPKSTKSKGLTIDSTFAAMTRSVELATAVHAECTHRRTAMQRSRSDSFRQRVLEQTMEIPVDWREFERVTPFDNASCLTTFPDEQCSAAGMGRTHCTGNFGSCGVGRGPMRLYSIRLKKRLLNSEGSMEKASSFPRLGTRVILSKSWV